jgi:formiminoglutamase
MSKIDLSYTWQGRQDLEDGADGKRWHQVINQSGHKSKSTLIGFSCDLGVAINKGRVGAVHGPNVIRDALANMAWQAKCDLFDAGNVVAVTQLDDAQSVFAQQIKQSLDADSFVVGLGGGHEIAWGSYQGLVRHLADKPSKKIAIINFDAHFDLRNVSPKPSSGTAFRQISEYCQANGHTFYYACLGVSESSNTQALFNYAKQTNTQYLLDMDCNLEAAKQLLEPMLSQVDAIYVTVCLDAFPSYVAPGVSAPSTIGIPVDFALQTIQWIAKSQEALDFEWQLADIAEMNPHLDIDNRTARLAATIVYTLVKAKFDGIHNIAESAPSKNK